MTYRELIEKLSKMNPDNLDNHVVVYNEYDGFKFMDGSWIGDGAEVSEPPCRRPRVGDLVIVTEDYVDEDDSVDEED